ncbi:histidine phosphatase superfamily [Biscogniauxia marginata]|nr:histidine phosphatase superfamily [Biscogniauxia marginata]
MFLRALGLMGISILIVHLTRRGSDNMYPTKNATFEVVSGFFEHDFEPTGPGFRATTKPGLGLINQAYDTDTKFDPTLKKTQWDRFNHYLEQLNAKGQGKILYKLIFVIRHGQGFHNVKEAEVGRHEWDTHWSHLDGDGKMSWCDSFLTDRGREQAKALKRFWEESIRDFNMPPPQAYYTSPLARCLETTKLAYSGLNVPGGGVFKPVVKEQLRERFGIHTCDRRRTRSWIVSNYPEYEVETGLAEDDEAWKADVRESEEEIGSRVRELLNDIFRDTEKTVVSFTAHSGLIRALYDVTKHREVWVAPGAIVPLLVKAEEVS